MDPCASHGLAKCPTLVTTVDRLFTHRIFELVYPDRARMPPISSLPTPAH
jgi:hypothetical protein